MPFKIVRNDITKMNTEAIVNTANEKPAVGTGCDLVVYTAAGFDELLSWRKNNIGAAKPGDVFISPGFRLPAKYIIHAVSPLYIDGDHDEERLLRDCYRKSLALAAEKGIASVAFPLISTGSFGYPKEEGMRIAVDEIHAFLLTSDMQIFLVVFDEKATRMGKSLYPDLETYIDLNYVREKREAEYGTFNPRTSAKRRASERPWPAARAIPENTDVLPSPEDLKSECMAAMEPEYPEEMETECPAYLYDEDEPDTLEIERRLAGRMEHMSDTFPQYLLYLIRKKGMENADVYKRAIVDKKVFSKIKNNPEYHPTKLTALCLCIGAKLNMDEAKDLLARAGYALSPCDKTDIIFSYFIEYGIYDMIELDIQLEEHGLPCIIA